ncbi:AMP-binding enzyme [Tistlia consotensis]|uniref:AMP-binding enzyme n=1 Tax=Tistlia consotensis USBA 355 TaxID=560819 RepID=A0A1Y6C6X2_9PROT|nr:AMP-binding protein [Tistlia consotensis]SMF39209.1 AMP-binding enzyme [Tistlia consotensis USBA 355]SNR36521.1 AMP-binding enzyme [Tistlia consotensis]
MTPAGLLRQAGGGLEFLGRKLPPARLAARAETLAAALAGRGVSEGATVALLLPDSPGLVAAVFALLARGARPQLLDPAAAAEAQLEALRDGGARLLLTYDLQGLIDRGLALLAERPDLRIGLLRASEELPFPRNLLAPLLRGSGLGQRPAHPAFFRLEAGRGARYDRAAAGEQLLFSDGPATFAELLGERPDTTKPAPLHRRAGFASLLARLSDGGRYRIEPRPTSSSA